MKNEELGLKTQVRSVCDLLNRTPAARAFLGGLGENNPIMEGTITIAMSRYPRENTHASARLATMLTLTESARVVYLNTFAGDEMMQEAFTSAALIVSGRDDSAGNTAQPSLDFDKLNELVIVNIPFGAWDSAAIAAAIPAGDAPLVVVLNDIEFAGPSAWQRQKVTRDLLRLHEATNATIVIFSHEMRTDIRAGEPGRGALGTIAMRAEAVYRFFGPFDHLIHTRNPVETATIHEAQTQVKEDDAPLKLTRNSLEAGVYLFESSPLPERFVQTEEWRSTTSPSQVTA